MALPIMKNLIWTPKRAGGKIVMASISELRIAEAEDKPVNFVWPDEGSFLKLQGSEDTFRMNAENDTLPPLVVNVRDARRLLKLYDEATSEPQQKLEGMIARSRAMFARAYDAAVSYESA